MIERFVKDEAPDDTYSFDQHLEAAIELRPRYIRRTAGGPRSLEGEYVCIEVGDQMLSIPVACMREALGMRPLSGQCVEVSSNAH